VRFVILGDLHYSFYPDPAISQGRELFYDNLLAEIADLQPDVAFSIGDAVNEGRVQEFEGLLNLVKKRGLRDRFVIVTGNHDVRKNSRKSLHSILQPPARFWPNYEVPDRGYYAFDYAAARFAVLDTTKELLSETDWGGVIDPAQLDWLRSEVSDFNQRSQPQILIVLAHHPLQNTTTKSAKEMMNISNSDEVWEVLASLKRGRGLYFNGHNHVNSLAVRDHWYFVQAGAPYRCGDYRVCDIRPNDTGGLKIEIFTHDIANGSESTFALANQLGDALEHFGRQEQPKGTPVDRHLVFESP